MPCSMASALKDTKSLELTNNFSEKLDKLQTLHPDSTEICRLYI